MLRQMAASGVEVRALGETSRTSRRACVQMLSFDEAIRKAAVPSSDYEPVWFENEGETRGKDLQG